MNLKRSLMGVAAIVGLVVAPMSPATAIEVPGVGTAPTVRADATTSSIAVEWDAVANASKYRYRIRQGSDPWSSISQTTARSVLFDDLPIDTEFTVAVGSRVNSKWKNQWSVVVIETSAPTGPIDTDGEIVFPANGKSPAVSVTVGVNSIELEWDDVALATRYRYRIRQGDGPWSSIQRLEPSVTSVQIDELQPSSEYTVAVGVRIGDRWQSAWTTGTVSTLDGPPIVVTPGDWLVAEDEDADYTDARTPRKYAFFDPDLLDEPGWDESRIGFLAKCQSVKFAQVDPIVNPGDARSAHLHEFFGNPNVDEFTTTQSLIDTPRGDIDCTDKNDKSSYWSPAVVQDGHVVEASVFSAYYRSTTADVTSIPLGLRMVAGNGMATENQSEQVGYWITQRDARYPDRFPIDCHERRQTPECAGTVGLDAMMTRLNAHLDILLVINFPNCWDGVHLDSPDHQSHMAYSDEVTATCPATHPVKVPQLTTRTRYDIQGGPGMSLASGEWFTFHQDFWNGWSPDQFAELTERCIGELLQCRVNATERLTTLGQFTRFVPAR